MTDQYDLTMGGFDFDNRDLVLIGVLRCGHKFSINALCDISLYLSLITRDLDLLNVGYVFAIYNSSHLCKI